MGDEHDEAEDVNLDEEEQPTPDDLGLAKIPDEEAETFPQDAPAGEE